MHLSSQEWQQFLALANQMVIELTETARQLDKIMLEDALKRAEKLPTKECVTRIAKVADSLSRFIQQHPIQTALNVRLNIRQKVICFFCLSVPNELRNIASTLDVLSVINQPDVALETKTRLKKNILAMHSALAGQSN